MIRYVSAVIVAAGKSRRMGRIGNKIWIHVAGRPILFYSIDAFLKAGIRRIVVVVKSSNVKRTFTRLRAAFPAHRCALKVVAGGRERQDSVWNGISATDTNLVLVHDAARAGVSPSLIRSVRRLADARGACVPVVALSDTLKRVSGRIVQRTESRTGLYGVQTPQGFRRELLLRAILAAKQKGLVATDCSALVESIGGKVTVTPGEPANLKLTRPADLKILRAILIRR